MSLIEYRTHIACATSSAELHEIRGLAEFDRQLSKSDRLRVAEAVGKRFVRLNAEAVGHQIPRWQ